MLQQWAVYITLLLFVAVVLLATGRKFWMQIPGSIRYWRRDRRNERRIKERLWSNQ